MILHSIGYAILAGIGALLFISAFLGIGGSKVNKDTIGAVKLFVFLVALATFLITL